MWNSYTLLELSDRLSQANVLRERECLKRWQSLHATQLPCFLFAQVLLNADPGLGREKVDKILDERLYVSNEHNRGTQVTRGAQYASLMRVRPPITVRKLARGSLIKPPYRARRLQPHGWSLQ
jgi:hypothetical protein